MLSLYEILKASKTGIAPDMWTALAGMNWGGADSGHEVKELTGIPPLSFTADGTPLLDYLISGNTVQNGTPTPSNPVDVNGVGVRTKNLLKNDAVSTKFRGVQYTVNADKSVTLYGTAGSQVSYFILMGGGAATNNLNAYTTPIFKAGDRLIFNTGTSVALQVRYTNGTYSNNIPNNQVITVSKDIGLIYVQVLNDSIDTTVYPMITLSTETDTDYEPYGYKIPISNGQQTTNIYLGSTQTTRQIEKITFDGSDDEDWYLERVNSYGIANFRLLNAIRPLKLGSLTWLSNRFVPQTSLIAQTETEGILLNPELICYIRIDSTTASTVTAFKQWLTENPVDLYYVLATPETAAVNEPLMKIGNYADTVSMEQAGVQIPTNRGNTVIDVLTELKPSQMYIKYQK